MFLQYVIFLQYVTPSIFPPTAAQISTSDSVTNPKLRRESTECLQALFQCS